MGDSGANDTLGHSGVRHHNSKDVSIQHARYRNSLRRGVDAGDAFHGIHQRFAVVRAGAAHQRSIDIKKHQWPGGFHLLL
jgi:hypothetical protein